MKIICGKDSTNFKVLDNNGKDITEALHICSAVIKITPRDLTTVTLECYVDEIEIESENILIFPEVKE